MDPLLQLLMNRRDAIVVRWLDRILESHAADQALFFKQEQDRFRNPVGHVLRESLPLLLDAVLSGEWTHARRSAVDAIVRLRAVQDLSPAQAVSFVPLLKDAVQDELRNCRQIAPEERGTAALESRIDELARLAAEMHAYCRDQIRQIQAGELHRRNFVITRMRPGAAAKESWADAQPPSGTRPARSRKSPLGPDRIVKL